MPASFEAQKTLRSGLLYLLAVAAAVSVANIYYAQPIAERIGESLHVSDAAMGAALMLTQIGYALGMLLLVPVGDGRERRGVIVATAAVTAVALLLVAASPSYPVFAATSLAVGFTSSLPQMIVPFAVGLVPPGERGRALGTVMSGLLAGILLSRTASGAVATLIGWRLTFVAAAVLMAILAVVLRWVLPAQRPPAPLPARAILRSLFAITRSEPLLRRHALIGALGFASFSVFWSMIAFHMADTGHGAATVGALAVLGVAGVVVAPFVGRLAQRVPPVRINAVALVATALAFAVFYAGAHSLPAIAVGVVLLDGGVQASHLANQTAIFGLAPELRNRLNAVYMVAYFVGGAAGTAVAALAWSAGRWPGVTIAGAAFALAGTAVAAASARGDLAAGSIRS